MKIKTIIYLLLISQIATAQENFKEEITFLAKTYHEYHFSNPSEEVFIELKSIKSTQLNITKVFIEELIQPKNEIASTKYLTKPDSTTLRNLYIIRALNYNMYEDEPQNSNHLLDSLLNNINNYHELISCYYGMLFTAISNKNRPLKMSKYNFTLNEYELENDVEKGIFFLESMEMFGTLIWGYINIPKPPNFEKALEIIENYPKYNGSHYYEYLDLDFDDFLLRVDKTKPKESFKRYYLNKYMNCVMSHSLCLVQNKETKKEALEVLFKSILANENYWKYSETPEIFEAVFKQIRG